MIAVKAMMDVTKRPSKLKVQISDFSKRLHRDQKGDTPMGSSNNKYTQIPKSLSFFSDVQAYNATQAAAISLPDILKICWSGRLHK
jgi:ubiquitin C-terminal hydrolase